MRAELTPTVNELRELYEQSGSAAAVLRVIAGSNPEQLLEWAKQMRNAFCLSLPDVKTIGGWSPDGTGELKDAQIDGFLIPAIEKNRDLWDVPQQSNA